MSLDGGEFTLQINPAELRNYSARYHYASDEQALAAGRRIACGELTFENLLTIFEWKTKGRGRSRILKNKAHPQEIAEILDFAVSARSCRAKIAVLTALDGVDVPVASAVLTAIDPDNYTIIDFRALDALGSQSKDRSIRFYVTYLKKCRELAKAHSMSLRDLDRALWQWSLENGRNAAGPAQRL